ncbi:hypothetical protein Gorai_014386 [Gossypium raimondii]|uniref:Uncharacterized protein n=1 Tax=Gossypium raimondii TaxID=29730 RepID=A0A7J8P2Z6_GOSRA|nr:hypothetical protein [Gossypium raimondii]
MVLNLECGKCSCLWERSIIFKSAIWMLMGNNSLTIIVLLLNVNSLINILRLNNLSGCLNSGAGYGWAVMVKSLLDFSLLFHL